MKIFEFAKIADWGSRLAELSRIAEQERWSYISIPANNGFPILDKYIKYTFLRAFDQQKILETEHSACFNTGLLTSGQEEIFCYFTVSETYDRSKPISAINQKWWLKSWLRSGEQTLTDFMELPALADYWSDSSQLIFDPKIPVMLNLDHIVKDNISRFPEELGGRVDKSGKPIDHLNDDDEESEADDYSTSSNISISARNALEGAVNNSIRLAKRSYRIAVPQFYRGKIQLLLPLYLRNSLKPDLALTLERNGGWYRAATVLYTDWAYTHARLLARPNSEWLGGFRSDALSSYQTPISTGAE
jgi:hypothetical protein